MIRVLAFDPGATTGWALIELDRPLERARLCASGELRADQPRGAREAVESVLTEAAADVVAVECTIGESFGGRTNVSDLVACARLDGMLVGWAEAHGLQVVEVPAASWRHALLRKPAARDREIQRALVFKLSNPPGPRKSNAHTRDAMGLAVVAAQAWSSAGAGAPLFQAAALREERRKARAVAARGRRRVGV
jgi:Holliday junction resolvasome RuvABC endonuclease subunit